MTDQPGDVRESSPDDPAPTTGWILVGLADGIFRRFDLEDTQLKVVIAQLDADEPYNPPGPRDFLFKGRVATHSINVRDNPSMQAKKVGFIMENEIVLVSDIQGWWWQHDRGGWSHSYWLRRLPWANEED